MPSSHSISHLSITFRASVLPLPPPIPVPSPRHTHLLRPVDTLLGLVERYQLGERVGAVVEDRERGLAAVDGRD